MLRVPTEPSVFRKPWNVYPSIGGCAGGTRVAMGTRSSAGGSGSATADSPTHEPRRNGLTAYPMTSP